VVVRGHSHECAGRGIDASVSERAPTYVEAVVRLRPGAEPADVAGRLEGYGLVTLPMQVGLLASGDRAALAKALEVGVDAVQPDARLPVPPALADHVSSIDVVAPRGFGGDA
jgi:hypothetical protein